MGVPEDLVRSVGNLDRTILLVRGGRVIRFMTLAAYAGIVKEEDTTCLPRTM